MRIGITSTLRNQKVNQFSFTFGPFQIINIERFPDNQVEIYNRWGVLVWETSRYDNKNNAFDGKSKGRITIIENQKLPSGVYFYEIKYVSDGEDKIKTGYLYVMR